ncbi:hypothetical protein U0C82_18020 [Fulvimarina sp. 2208YS6-2-32]|uniref:Uncharacterized protein n=1 Tax=Fulvimarina uroteuthidis TaxID=3098149 RepID=A0ABU5I6L9_9HYPH|nr:hypothetical protein [Fulvimarina sp. 2208YS6-2-32]MDY8111029.1 hypothetical protein [Fulvimarina sp. 2208YS6-2-32]
MVAIHGLETASRLLRPTVDSNASTVGPNSASVPSIADIALAPERSHAGPGSGASSAIFNAVVDMAEKVDAAMGEVVSYIDRDHAQVESVMSNLMAAMGYQIDYREAIANDKAAGERLKEQALADPERTYRMLEKIKADRPGISLDEAMAFLMVDLGKLIERNAQAKL